MAPVSPQKRNGFWYLIRRVPARYAAVDARRILRISTHIRVADDPHAIRAAQIAAQLNRDLEEEWRAKANGLPPKARRRYDDAVLDAAALGFDYLPAKELMMRPVEELVRRVEVLVGRRLGGSPEATSSVLGGEEKPAIMTGELLDEYEALNKAMLAQMSPDQVRKWKNQRQRAVENLKAVIGDKPLDQLTRQDALRLRSWWADRVANERVLITTANKDLLTIGRMYNKVNEAKALGLPDVFSKLAIEGGKDGQRQPYDVEFIQNRILAAGMFDDINEEARRVVYVMVETGLRPSEIVNLTPQTIHLDSPVPYVEVKPEGRVVKAEASVRKMPLVGVSLAAMQLQPKGFPRYRDKSASLSALVNKSLDGRGLRPTPGHSLYSLRHSFEDRLTALKVMPDKIQAYLMGHAYSRPKYGSEPPLPDLQEWLAKIALPRFPDKL